MFIYFSKQYLGKQYLEFNEQRLADTDNLPRKLMLLLAPLPQGLSPVKGPPSA